MPGAPEVAPSAERATVRAVALAVALATIAVYVPALGNGFVNWDDPEYVLDNAHIRTLDAAFVRWAFSPPEVSSWHWHPLTWFSHALDYQLWGPRLFGHHLTSVVLHAINAALVLLLAVRLLEAHAANPRDGRRAPAALAPSRAPIVGVVTALLFALHPAHVESVAWISERKDVLCAAFYLCALLLYLRHARRTPAPEGRPGSSRWGRPGLDYALMTGSFVLALLSKPMAVTFPVALLVLDVFPLRRLSRAGDRVGVLAEKVPLLALSLASSAVAVLAQREALGNAVSYPLAGRLLAASAALTAYLGKMAWPAWLVPFYPHPLETDPGLLSLRYLAPLAANLGVTIACLALARRSLAPAAAWACYVLALVPVLGVVQVARQGMADRYTYLPSVPVFLMAGVGAALLWERAGRRQRGAALAKAGLAAAAAAAVVALSVKTVQQIPVWRDGVALWSHQLEVMRERGIADREALRLAHTNRGQALQLAGNPLAAISDYTALLALDPDAHAARLNRAEAFATLGRHEDAARDYDEALRRRPAPDVYLKRAQALARLGRDDEAVRDYGLALAKDFGADASVHYNRANAFARMGRFAEALADYTTAIERSAGSEPDYFRNRAFVLEKLGRGEEAARDARRARALGGAGR